MSTLGSSIVTALGAGSGIDTSALVKSLVSASRDPKQQAITSQQSLNSSRISAVGSAISSLDTFADALTEVLSGAAYTGTPSSSDAATANISVLSGGTPAGLPVRLSVQQLATARALSSTAVAGAKSSDPVGTGTLTIKGADGTETEITVDYRNNSYSGLAAAINASGSGVTARVVTDQSGTRLVLKGETGVENDFTVAVTGAADGTVLKGLAWDNGVTASTMTSNSEPQNAKITLDGQAYEYASNTIDGAIPYLRIGIAKVSEPGTSVTLSMTQPTAGLSDLLKEFVSAYNTLSKALATATSKGTDSSNAGVLNGVSAVRDMQRQLAALTSTPLASTGTFRTLADIGITTNRDGTLTLDSTRLAAAMEADPEGVTNMVNPKTATAANPGLSKLMDDVRDNIEQDNGSLKLLQKRYQDLAKGFTDQLTKLDTQMSSYEEQLTKIYAAMDTRLAALKATQSYLDQQVKVWTNSKD
ncbi:flagellar hook protein [Sphingobium amiense]|uniref:Flagellar hook-associated protein 2 n=1 Tax=Sphingobium amiense TaxID=135719 RepID=A0A494W6G0_9SPHN|nr:flagellar filament capping protein FliD [Sphingobium amiense]BBD98906.1 flagellar hook protein [Sphingobium amiense]